MNTTFIFEKLYEKSKQLVQPTASTLYQLPYIERELDQINTESQLLANKTKGKPNDPYIKAHYLLAQGGVNQHEISQVLKKLDTSHTFERREALLGTDVPKYLEKSYQDALKDAFDEEDDICQIFGDIKNDSIVLGDDWEVKAQYYTTQWDQRAPTIKLPANRIGHAKETEKEKEKDQQYLLELANAVRQLNDQRLVSSGKKFDFIAAVSTKLLPSTNSQLTTRDSLHTSAPSPPSNEAEETQQLLQYLVTQYDQANDTHSKCRQASLISISKSWLEKQYRHYVDNTLWKHASRAKSGGNPSFTARLQSFIQFVFKKGSRWTDDRLQIMNGLPMWLYVYMLMRSGRHSLAKDYIDSHSVEFEATAPSFPTYFRQYMEHPGKRLPRQQAMAILVDYEQMKYGDNIIDPYRLLVYKIVGKCDVDKSAPTVIRSSEDYIWLQLSLIEMSGGQQQQQQQQQQEQQVDEEESMVQHYSLRDVHQKIDSIGSSRYDRNGNNPWPYFKVLIATLQLEKAIAYLYGFEQCRVAAVHYGIVLAYHGLLNFPTDPLSDALITESNQQVSLNFVRLIREYVKKTLMDHLPSAEIEQAIVQYFYLLSLGSQDCMTKYAFLYIQDLISAFPRIEIMLGKYPSFKGRQPGFIDQHKRLLGIQNEAEYSTHVLHPIGERLVKKGKYTEAIHVCRLSDDDNKVIDVLIQEMGDTLLAAMKDIVPDNMHNVEGRPQREQEKSLVNMAQSTLQHCETHLKVESTINPVKKQLVHAFILLFKGVWFYEDKKEEQAFWALQASGVLPLADIITLGHIQSICDQLNRLSKLEADALYKNMPGLVILSANILYTIWLSLTRVPDHRSAMMPHIHQVKQQMRNLLHFIGILSDKIPAGTTDKLNKIDIQMTTPTEQRFV